MLLKFGRPVAKCDPWIQRATQGPNMDGPFGDQLILYDHDPSDISTKNFLNPLKRMRVIIRTSTDGVG